MACQPDARRCWGVCCRSALMRAIWCANRHNSILWRRRRWLASIGDRGAIANLGDGIATPPCRHVLIQAKDVGLYRKYTALRQVLVARGPVTWPMRAPPRLGHAREHVVGSIRRNVRGQRRFTVPTPCLAY